MICRRKFSQPAHFGGALRGDPLSDERRVLSMRWTVPAATVRAQRVFSASVARRFTAVWPTSKSIPKKNSLTCLRRYIVETVLRHFVVSAIFRFTLLPPITQCKRPRSQRSPSWHRGCSCTDSKIHKKITRRKKNESLQNCIDGIGH